MAKAIETLSIQLKFKDAGSQAVIEKLRGSLKRLEMGAAGARPNIKGLRNEILTQGSASVKSVANINAQRSALQALRDEAKIGGSSFKQLTADIKKFDAELEKAGTRQGGAGGRNQRALAATQIAGAVVSGGIFGGPEGAIGGLGGAAIGGVSGAFAGAAIGAQVGGLRQTLGEFASYAAQIEKLNIALEGITGTQTQYNRALSAAADVTNTLNVPQEVAIQGITRLTAAVKGAGGGVAEAELAFKNINSAIIATGGGSEQVQGAVTALVQIFSKGKVSAEEINQIAERLPGTFNKIAAASGRTGPELTKALEKGEVGLNDLMKFLVSLGDEYGDLAEKIAGSSENAGARLQVAYNNMRIDVGDALQPIGAEFQDAFKEFIEDITPAMARLLPQVGKFALDLAKNLDILAASAAAAGLAMGAVAVAGMKFTTTAGVVFTGLGAALMKAATAAGALAVILNPYVAIAAGVAALTVHLVKTNREQEKLNRLLDEGEGSTKVMKDKIKEYEDSIAKAEKKIANLDRGQRGSAATANRLTKEVKQLKGELDRLKGTYDIRLNFEKQGFKFDDKGIMEEFTAAGIVYGGKRGARAKALRRVDGSPLEESKGFPESKDEDEDDKDTGASKIASALSSADSLSIQLTQKLDDLNSKISGVGETATEAINRKYGDALRKADEQAAKNIARITKLEKQSGVSFPAIRDQINDVKEASKEFAEAMAMDQMAEEISRVQKPLNDLMKNLNEEIIERGRIEELVAKGMNESLAREIANIEKVAANEARVLEIKLDQARLKLAEGGLDEKRLELLREEIRLLERKLELTPGRQKEAVDSAKELDEKKKSPVDIITKGLNDAKDRLEELTNIGNIVVNSANMIGDAFGKAFSDVVTGSATAKEALADMMQSIGQSFIKMAAEIIAEQTKMIILGTIMKALNIAFGASSGGTQAPSDVPQMTQNAIVTPTGFQGQFAGMAANGGPVEAGRPYMVGERGPEMFIPGSNGGIMRNEDMRRMMGNSPAGAGSPQMNFTFETTNIGGTEFVSREQLEVAMATTRRQAASDGAKQGMSMTLDKMQNSPRTRSRVGIR